MPQKNKYLYQNCKNILIWSKRRCGRFRNLKPPHACELFFLSIPWIHRQTSIFLKCDKGVMILKIEEQKTTHRLGTLKKKQLYPRDIYCYGFDACNYSVTSKWSLSVNYLKCNMILNEFLFKHDCILYGSKAMHLFDCHRISILFFLCFVSDSIVWWCIDVSSQCSCIWWLVTLLHEIYDRRHYSI